MKLARYPIQMFEAQKPEEKSAVVVPEGSKFLQAVILPDGIHVFYEVPEIETTDRRTDVFYLLRPDQSIPENCEFVAILDTIINSPQGQGLVLFPIYKQK